MKIIGIGPKISTLIKSDLGDVRRDVFILSRVVEGPDDLGLAFGALWASADLLGAITRGLLGVLSAHQIGKYEGKYNQPCVFERTKNYV